jgi:hypothetical protein
MKPSVPLTPKPSKAPIIGETQAFLATGHLSELALSTIADAEFALLPEAAIAHVEACQECAAQVGALAVFSAELAEAYATVPIAAKAAWKTPWKTAVASALLAAAASLWSLGQSNVGAQARTLLAAKRSLPLVGKALLAPAGTLEIFANLFFAASLVAICLISIQRKSRLTP